MYEDWLTEAHRRREQIGWELMFLEANIKEPGYAEKARALKAERREIERKLDIFYNDPITEYYGL